MKAYLIRTDFNREGLYVGEFEVEERSKTYKVLSKCDYLFNSVIKKSDIDVVSHNQVISLDKEKGFQIFKKDIEYLSKLETVRYQNNMEYYNKILSCDNLSDFK